MLTDELFSKAMDCVLRPSRFAAACTPGDILAPYREVLEQAHDRQLPYILCCLGPPLLSLRTSVAGSRSTPMRRRPQPQNAALQPHACMLLASLTNVPARLSRLPRTSGASMESCK